MNGSNSVKDWPAAEESPAVEDWPAADEDTLPGDDTEAAGEKPDLRSRSGSAKRLVISLGVVAAVLGCLVGWLGYRTYEIRAAQDEQQVFVEAARLGAVNLTTFGFDTTEADIQRILDSTTGSFHEDFQMGQDPFVAVIKQAKSRSEGTVTAAGLESQDGDRAQVLVAVSVKTSNAGAPEQEPRAWRMRIGVDKVGVDAAKVSSVTFVP
ncbi:hypothetical protein KXD97_26390 [Mycobacterium sp. SMC-8]|uniref:hypothetical protein n=1 Tax=Mycobacterium sp. SMC-8 TaxID=2857060 RepID=UPI0021B16069|nr:hypothetical protein [Mycobacterium sp. SMC-8]UXA11501.1 hypothetical protein KXD97_26390 [Mycobacterium sp. SMC-8]